MKLLLMFLIVCSASNVFGQITRDRVVGSWLCSDVTLLPDTAITKEKWEDRQTKIKTGFLDSKFTFNADSTFSYDVPVREWSFAQMIKSVSDRKWFFDSTLPGINIGPNLVSIMVKEDNDAFYFALSGTPIVLHMKRVQ